MMRVNWQELYNIAGTAVFILLLTAVLVGIDRIFFSF